MVLCLWIALGVSFLMVLFLWLHLLAERENCKYWERECDFYRRSYYNLLGKLARRRPGKIPVPSDN